jgi:hypothetical protein
MQLTIDKLCRVSKYPGYTTKGKKWHPAHLLNQPAIGEPKSTDSISATQGANDKFYLARALWRGLGNGVIKGARPPTVCFCLAQGA